MFRFIALSILTLLSPVLLSCYENTTEDKETAINNVNERSTGIPNLALDADITEKVITGTSITPTTTVQNVERITETTKDYPEKIPALEFTRSSTLCQDNVGPDCSALRLGDDYLSTSGPAKGYLYSCNDKNPNAPGSIESKITWINFVDNVWDFLKKPWLPDGAFRPEAGIYTETLSTEDHQININNLPVDGKIGDWPMTKYPTLTEIDQNPGIPSSSNSSFTYPVSPSYAPSPTCVSPGAIGVTKNGVVIYNAADGRGEDAVAREIVDIFGGHPARTNYHYHFIPERLDNEYLSDGHSSIVGYINDGFPIYGYKGEGGKEMSNYDLDECHGHAHGSLGYHYHATIEYPYTVGCYKGASIELSSLTVSPQRGQQ